jgi:hypothetical protein
MVRGPYGWAHGGIARGVPPSPARRTRRLDNGFRSWCTRTGSSEFSTDDGNSRLFGRELAAAEKSRRAWPNLEESRTAPGRGGPTQAKARLHVGESQVDVTREVTAANPPRRLVREGLRPPHGLPTNLNCVGGRRTSSAAGVIQAIAPPGLPRPGCSRAPPRWAAEAACGSSARQPGPTSSPGVRLRQLVDHDSSTSVVARTQWSPRREVEAHSRHEPPEQQRGADPV